MNARFVKFFRLLNSDQDGEALSALRHIVREVTKEGISWNEFVDNLARINFGKQSTQSASNRHFYRPPPAEPYQDVEQAFKNQFQSNDFFGGFTNFTNFTSAKQEAAQQAYREQRAYDQAGPNMFEEFKAARERDKQEQYAKEEMEAREKAEHDLNQSKKWCKGFRFSQDS